MTHYLALPVSFLIFSLSWAGCLAEDITSSTTRVEFNECIYRGSVGYKLVGCRALLTEWTPDVTGDSLTVKVPVDNTGFGLVIKAPVATGRYQVELTSGPFTGMAEFVAGHPADDESHPIPDLVDGVSETDYIASVCNTEEVTITVKGDREADGAGIELYSYASANNKTIRNAVAKAGCNGFWGRV